MSRITEVITGIEGVGPGQSGTFRLAVNRRYHWIELAIVASLSSSPVTDIAAIVKNVELYVGGKLISNMSGKLVKAIPAFNGVTVAAGTLKLYFSEPWRASVMDEQASAWEVNGVSDFVIKVNFADASVIDTVSMTGVSCWDYGSAKNSSGQLVRNILSRRVYNINAAGGQQDIVQLDTAFPIQRIYVISTALTVSQVEVNADGFRVMNLLKARNDQMLADYHIDSSQFTFPVVFDANQQLFDALNVAKDLNVLLHTSGPGQVQVYLEQRKGDYV